MKNIFLLLGLTAIVLSCSQDPYKDDKALIEKAINTVGKSEIIRKVEFEKFEPAGFLSKINVDHYYDSLIDLRYNEIVVQQEREIARRKKAIESRRHYEDRKRVESERKKLAYATEQFKTHPEAYGSEIAKYSRRLKVAEEKLAMELARDKEDLKAIQESAKLLKEPKSDYLIKLYVDNKNEMHGKAFQGDTVVYYYDVVFVIDNIRTTTEFTIGIDGVEEGKAFSKLIQQ